MATSDTERWCELSRPLHVGGATFGMGRRFRIAGSYQRPQQEMLLTLDGNKDERHWSGALVIHNVPASAVNLVAKS